MDYDDIQSDGEQPQDPTQQQPHDHFLDDNLDDDIEGEEDGGNWRDREPGYEPEQSLGKPRKRLVKKGAARDDHVEGSSRRVDDFIEDDVDGVEGFVRESSEERRMKRKKEREGTSVRKEMRGFSGGGGGSSSKGENRMKSGILKKRAVMGRRNDGEVKEMWDTIAGGDSEVRF